MYTGHTDTFASSNNPRHGEHNMKTTVDCQQVNQRRVGDHCRVSSKLMFSLHLTNLDTPSSVILIDLAFHLVTAGDWAMF